MTPAKLKAAIGAIELALANRAMVDAILGHGASQDNRDIELGLDAEQSQRVLEAILAALRQIAAK